MKACQKRSQNLTEQTALLQLSSITTAGAVERDRGTLCRTSLKPSRNLNCPGLVTTIGQVLLSVINWQARSICAHVCLHTIITDVAEADLAVVKNALQLDVHDFVKMQRPERSGQL